MRLGSRWAAWAFPLGFVMIWEAVVRGFDVPPERFPTPSATALSLVRSLGAGELTPDILATLERLGKAFALAAVPGVLLGLLLGLIPALRRLLDPYVALLYTVPKIAILPLVIIMLGRNEKAFVATASLSAFAQIVVTTCAGVLAIDERLIEAGRNFGATGWRLYAKVILPAALPAVWTGLRLGLGLALILVIAIEFIITQTGLGHLVWRYWNMLVLEEMYAALILVGVLGAVITSGLLQLGRRLMPWTSHD